MLQCRNEPAQGKQQTRKNAYVFEYWCVYTYVHTKNEDKSHFE